jgi:hypothetical protein
MIQHLIDVLGAPLVDHKVLGVAVAFKELLGSAYRLENPAKLRASQPFSTFAGHQYGSSS